MDGQADSSTAALVDAEGDTAKRGKGEVDRRHYSIY